MNSNFLLAAFTGAAAGPTLLGVDVIGVATMMAAVGVGAVLVAIYGAMTVRNPMTKRVKALNDRREQLKAGITASTTKRRAKLIRKNQHADKMRSVLGKLQVLQESQIKDVQQKLAQAGIRSKDLAVAVSDLFESATGVIIEFLIIKLSLCEGAVGVFDQAGGDARRFGQGAGDFGIHPPIARLFVQGDIAVTSFRGLLEKIPRPRQT